MKRSASNNIENDLQGRQRARTEDHSSAMSALFRALETQANGGMNAKPAGALRAGNQSATGSLSDSAQSSGSKTLTYPKPRNFAERLMFVLQSEVATDSIWWVEGKAVALHQKRLKKGTVMQDHFNVKDFSGFIRNCNRWGFRRVSSYDVPDGVVTYESSLFIKKNPQLVKHMRMDSDVQDVFAKHIALGGDQGSLSRLPMELQSIILSNQQQAAVKQAPTPQVPSTMPNLLVDQQRQLQANLQQLQQQQQQQQAPQQMNHGEKPHQLLRQIMDLSQKYLDHPESNTHKGIRTILQLLNVLGHDIEKEIRQEEERERQAELERARQQEQQRQQQAADNSTSDVVSQLAQLIAQAARQQQLKQQGSPSLGSNAMGGTTSPQQQSQQPVAGFNSNNQMVMNFQGQAALRGAGQPPAPQPFGNFGQPQVQGSQQQQLLALWAQQQQQQKP